MYACVCTAFLAAQAAGSGGAAATSSSPISLTNDAYQSLMQGKTQEAISAYSEAIESRQLQPERLANALLNRGLAYQQMSDTTRAIDDYTAALRIDALGAKLRATALYNRGIAYQKIKQPAMAIEDYTNALFLDPQFAHAYYSRANVLKDSGQYLFALSDYEKAIRFNHPQPFLVHYGEALTQEALKRPALAQRAYELSLKDNPSYAPARAKLASLGIVTEVAETLPPPDLTTGSITGTGPDQVVRKEVLPAAVEPPPELGGGAVVLRVSAGRPEKPAKLFTDRVPAEEWASSERIQVSEASEPAKAVEPVPAKSIEPAPAKPAEPAPKKVVAKIVAIEALPDIEPAASVGTDEPVPAKTAKPFTKKVGAKTRVKVVAEAEPAAEIEPAAETESAAEGETTASIGAWTIQLSSAKEEKMAWDTWSKIKKRHKLAQDLKPVVVRADLGSKGIYYRLRLGGYENQSDAQGVCSKLKSRGVTCFVSKVTS
ncbi:hypothetical protein BH10PSE7_BH10PSE7_10130 [soil metagenome]